MVSAHTAESALALRVNVRVSVEGLPSVLLDHRRGDYELVREGERLLRPHGVEYM
jgi:hypothetical protein